MFKIIRLAVFLILGFVMVNGNAQVIINEYSCANATSGGDPDFYGEMEDWVELYNTSGAAINLNGYYISDKAGNPTKFQVPGSISIPAGGYLMVYGSKRGVIAGGQIHTTFKWTQTKNEKIILSDAGGTIIDSLTITPNQLLHSRGRTTDGAATWSVFTNSTPNGANTGAMQEYATTPIFSVQAGFYPGAQSVTITTPDPNITIYYTTDGSEPTTGSNVYSGTVNIPATTVLRAKCFSSTPTIPASFIETNTYFINSPHTVPVFSICGDDVGTLLNGTQLEPIGAIEYFDASGVMKTEGQGTFDKHGNDSWAYNQRGVDFVMKDQFGYNYALKEQLFANKSRTKFQRVILKAGASDNYPFEGQANSNYAGELGGIHLRDPYVQALSQQGDLILDERTHQSCVMYVNGQYWGVYDVREKVDDSDFLDYYYDQDEQWKDSPNYIQYLKTWGGTWEKYGAPNAQNDWNALLNFITTNNMATPANFTYVTSQYKWKSLVDYFVLNSYILNKDMLNWNTSWWRGLDTNGSKTKWRYSLWDMDATFNHYTNYTGIPSSNPAADPCNIDNLPNPGGQGHTVILNALMNNPTFQQYYISRYIDLSNTTLSCSNMIAVLDSLVNIITPEMPGQIARWGGTMAEWNQNVLDMKTFINDRCAAMNVGLVNCYNVTGPFPMQYNVNPPNSGDIQINSITPANYVYSGNYFGNIDILLKATPNTGYMFDYWEIFNHTLDSAITNENNSVQITQGDSVIAHFIVIGDTVELTFNVDPVGGGDISIDGFTPPSYSYSNFYPETSTLNLIATPQPGFVFVNWTSNSTAFVANPTDSAVQITVNLVDSIVAHFAVIDSFELVFNVDPVGGGDISIDGFTPPSYTYTDTYVNSSLNLVATPQPGFVFVNWTSNGTPFIANATDSAVTITVAQADSIVAHFAVLDSFSVVFNVDPIGGGDISIDGFTPPSYSYTDTYIENTTLNLVATPQLGYIFVNWTSNGTPFVASSNDPTVSVTIAQADSLVAHFAFIDTFDIVFRVNPLSMGEVSIDTNTIFDDLTTTSVTKQYITGTTVDLVETPISNLLFDHWESYLHTLSPSTLSSTVNFVVVGSDTITAVYVPEVVPPPNGADVPMGFSPNGDGNNDILYVYGNEIESISFDVYDRWGELVFSSTTVDNGWDGNYNGKAASSGVYVYKMKAIFIDGEIINKNGDITLVR
jgi:gliding motility-associated-like protein